MAGQSLFEISSRYVDALDYLTNPENDIDTQTISDTMDALEGEISDKALNVARYIVNLESLATAIKEQEQRMIARRKAAENQASRLREYLAQSMQRVGIPKAIAGDIQVTLAKLPASVHVIDESAIPAEFWREKIERSIDKMAIKQAGGCPGAVVESAGMRVAIK